MLIGISVDLSSGTIVLVTYGQASKSSDRVLNSMKLPSTAYTVTSGVAPTRWHDRVFGQPATHDRRCWTMKFKSRIQVLGHWYRGNNVAEGSPGPFVLVISMLSSPNRACTRPLYTLRAEDNVPSRPVINSITKGGDTTTPFTLKITPAITMSLSHLSVSVSLSLESAMTLLH
jgi:hypothetical protein